MAQQADEASHAQGKASSWPENSTPAFGLEPASPDSAHAIPEHELLSRIGGGSYGEVWLARSVLGSYRAVKIVHRRSFDESESFEREFKGLQKFEPISRTHEGLMDILQVGRTEDSLYYVMELADNGKPEGRRQKAEVEHDSTSGAADVKRLTFPSPGQAGSQSLLTSAATYAPRTLRSDLTERGRLPAEECLRIGLRLTSALAHLHQHGLVHRDVKPSNVIFVHREAKLADVGLVTETTEAHSFVGTVGYIPPDGPGSPQADLFGLGKVLYEISTGCKRDDFPKLPPDLHELPDREDLVELNEVILKACEDNPKARYQSAEEMSAHLRRVQEGKSVRRIRWLEKRLALGRKVGLALLGSALVAGLISYQAWRGRQTATQHLARLHLEQGIERMEEGDFFGSLLHFTRGLELEAGDQRQEANHRLRIGTILQHCPKPVGIFGAETSLVRGADFSPDGRCVLTIHDDQAVRVWSLETEDLVHTLPHDRPLVDALYSPDGGWIVTTKAGAQAQVWNATTGQRSGLPFGHLSAPLPSKAFGSAYTFFLVTNGVRILKSFEELAAEPAQLPRENMMLVLCLTGEGEKVRVKARVESTEGAALFDRDCLDWPLDPDQTVPRQEMPGFVGVRGSPLLFLISDFVANDTSDHEVVYDDLHAALFDVPFGTQVWSRVVDNFNDNRRENWLTRQVADSQLIFTNQQLLLRGPNGDSGYGMSAELLGEFFEIEDGRRLELRVKVVRARNASPGIGFWIRPFYHHQRTQDLSFRPQTLAFSPDDQHLACLRSFHEAEVRKLPSGELISQFSPDSDWLRSVWFSPDGRRVFSAAGSSVYVRDRWTGQPVREPFDHGASIRLAGMSAHGRWMATLGYSRLRIWDVARGVSLDWTNAYPRNPTGFAFSPDGTRLLVIDGDEVVQCLDPATGRRLLPDLPHEYPVLLCGFSPDARRLVTVTDNHLCSLWHATEGRPIAPSLPHYAPAGLPKFSPDGRFLLTVDPTRGAYLWDLGKIHPAILAIPLSTGYSPAAQSPNGQFQIRFADDIKLVLEDKPSGQSVPFPHSGHIPPLKQLKFTADSRWLVVEGRDARVQIWDVQSGDLLTPQMASRYVALPVGFPEIRLPCEDRPLAHLIALGELLAQSRLDPDGGTVPLRRDELRKRWGDLRRRYPQDLDRNPAEGVQWHKTNALQCEQDWDWWGAQFHLSRLAQLQPQDTHIRDRLSYAQQALASVEAQPESWPDRVKVIPPRPPWATVHHLDLTRSANPQGFTNYLRSIKEDLWSDWPGPNRFGQLPCGIQNLAGVEWDIRCYVRLGRKPMEGRLLFPTNVMVPVGQRCKRIHFLHASDGETGIWNEVGRYVVRFADGPPAEIPIHSRCDLFSCRMAAVYPLALHKSVDLRTRTAVPAWAGTSSDPQSEGRVLRLFKFTWENPNGPQEVASIELTSGQNQEAAPFVVAITVE